MVLKFKFLNYVPIAPYSCQMSRIDNSLWIKSVDKVPTFHSLNKKEGKVDVAIIGAGIFGLTTALYLAEKGKSVVVLEGGRVGRGVTGNTTGKITSLHNDEAYRTITKTLGVTAAHRYAEMNEKGIEIVENIVKRYNIDCNFVRADNYTYCTGENKIEELRKETEAAVNAGLKAEFSTETPEDLPFKIAAHIRVRNQARFNAYAYCIGLAEKLDSKDRVKIYENSRVINVEGFLKPPFTLRTNSEATIEADNVVIATGTPITDRSGHFAFMKVLVSYCIAFQVNNEELPLKGMFIGAHNDAEPSLSIRPAEDAHGHKVVVVAGSGHESGEVSNEQRDTEIQYRRLEELARKKLPYLGAVLYRWSANDFKAPDGAPYIGYLHRGTNHMFTATGFMKWGLAGLSGAALAITDLMDHGEHPWTTTFDARRWDLTGSLVDLVKSQLHVTKHFIGDRIYRNVPDIEDIKLGSGGICQMQNKVIGVFKDEEGKVFAVDTTCTHLGCHVNWNSGDRTWDCPCHGSRFTVDGHVYRGPALKPLKTYDIKEQERPIK